MNARLGRNVDANVARGFGDEWSTFRQGEDNLACEEREAIFESYFGIFPRHLLPPGGGVGADIGCGSGRWAMMVAPRVGHLHLFGVSQTALAVASENLRNQNNVSFHESSVADIGLASQSLDFAFSLGVLHHVPETLAALESIADRLKSGVPFLVYLDYAFDNRPARYRALWASTNGARLLVSRFPHSVRIVISETIAALVYWPLARVAAAVSRFGVRTRSLPLSWYADKSFYVMRDAYDRFCTRLEKRSTRAQIEQILARSGFEQISFSNSPPYWCAVAIKSQRGRSV